MQQVYELRYNVYCLERRFLDAEAYADGLETDAYDEKSEHFCAYNPQRELIGYVRLIEADVDGRFPWQDYCTDLLEGVSLPPRSESAEISRLILRQDYRRRRGDTVAGAARSSNADVNAQDRRTPTPPVLLSLYRQMYQHSNSCGTRYWYAAMEQPLARSLQLMRFPFKKIGRETDYFGPVAPYVLDLRELEVRLEKVNPELLAYLQRPDRSDS